MHLPPLLVPRPLASVPGSDLSNRCSWARKLPAPLDSMADLMFGTSPRPEPKELHGAVYRLDPDGQETLLQYGSSRQTTELPADAIQNNRLVIAVEGLWENLPAYQYQWYKVAQPQVQQTMIGVHEGNHPIMGTDVMRMVKNHAFMKALQWFPKAVHHVAPAAYRRDPSVRAVHDLVGQALDKGADVLLIPHSAGGPQTALALTILSAEGRRGDIEKHVRVLSLATAASPACFHHAGVAADNLYYTGDIRDPVWHLAQTFTRGGGDNREHARAALRGFGGDWHHNLADVIEAEPIKAFIDGGPGGIQPR